MRSQRSDPALLPTRGGTGVPASIMRFAASVAVVVAASAASAAMPRSPTAPRVQVSNAVIGIVEVPRLFGPGAAVGTTVLRQRPVAESPVVVTIAGPDGVESAELDYEVPGALVFGREEGWSQLRTSDGTAGWLAPSDADAYHPLEELLEEGLVHLTDAWDGSVRAAPETGAVTPVPPDPRRRIVGTLSGQVVRQQFVLQEGADPDELRNRYRASASNLRRRADGTRVLTLEMGTPHPLHEAPDPAAGRVGEVETNRASYVLTATPDSPTRVPVFERRDGWVEVALRTEIWQEARRVWLRESDAWRFEPMADPAAASELMARVWGPVTRSARVVAHRRIGTTLWIEVELLRDSPCEVFDEPVVVARGWIAAHDATGAPTAWFSSRGC